MWNIPLHFFERPSVRSCIFRSCSQLGKKCLKFIEFTLETSVSEHIFNIHLYLYSFTSVRT
jgi:hypothetical protein